MKNLKQNFNKLKENIKDYFSKITFRKGVIILGGIFFVLFIINSLLTVKNNNTDNTLIVGSDNTVKDSTGKVVSYYDIISPTTVGVIGSKVIIYVDNPNTATSGQLKALAAAILASKGLNEDQVSILLKKTPEDIGPGGDFTASTDSFDPTDPSTFAGKDLNNIIKYDAEPMNMDFKTYAAINTNSDDFAISKDSDTVYTVILKNGYTQDDFQKQILNQLTSTNGVQINYIDLSQNKANSAN